jgi:hypothetical protein
MAEEFTEEDLRTGIPLTEIPESGFEPTTMTLEPPQELPSPRQFVPTAIEDTEAFAPVSLEEPPTPPPTQDIAELEAGGFQWPTAEPTPRWKPMGEAPPIISISPERPQYQPVDEAYAKTSDYFNNGFRDEKFLAAESDVPEINELEKTSFDPNNVRIRAWNWGYLQWRTGRKFANDGEYEAARDADNKERNPNKPVTSDIEYFNDRKKEAQGEHELKQAETELLSRAVLKGATDYAQGKPIEMMALIDEVRQKYPSLNDPAVQERATIVLRSAASHIKQTLDPLMPDIGKAMPLVQKLARGEDMTATIRDLGKILKGDAKTQNDLTPEQIKRIDDILGYSALGLHAIDPTGKNRELVFTGLDSLRKDIIYGLGFATAGSITQQEDTLLDARRRLANGEGVMGADGRLRFSPLEQLPGAPQPAGRPLTPQERIDLGNQLDDAVFASWFDRRIRHAIQKDIDPVRTVLEGEAGKYERLLVHGPIQSVPFMAAGVLPAPVSDVVWWWATREQEFNDLLVNNPGMSREDASRLANSSASWQAPFNRIEGEVLLNRIPALKGVVKDFKTGNWKTALVKLGVKTVAENVAENAQNFISNVTQEYGNQIADQARATDPSWSKASEKAFRETVAQMPDTFITLAPMMLIGAGITHITDYNMSRQELEQRFSLVGLVSQGLGLDQAIRVMSQKTWDAREKQFQKEYQNRDPATMREANARNAAAAAEGQAQFDKQATAPAMPSFESRRLDDGTQEYTVRDPEGNVVMTTTNRTVFEGVYQEQVEKAMTESLAAEEAAAASEEGQATTAEAEGALRVLEPESRTSAAYLLEFDDEQQPTPERSAAVARLEAALAKDPRSGGKPIKLIPVTRRVGAATVSGQKLNETIDGLSRLFGKNIVFIRSGTGEDLPFTGIVNPSDPNTIFLDAAGDRNVLALIGHEWSHTLKLTNPQLHAAMVAQMRPLVHDWLNQEARLKGEEGYTQAQLTDELVGNIIGDAFTRPDFLALLNQRNPSLFERVVKAIEEFFNSLIAAARGSEWATEGFITDLEAMHEVIASTIEQARTAGPEVVSMAPEGELSFAGRRKVEQGFYRKVDEVVDAKLPNTSTAQQAKATINSAGLKAEEIKWTGVIPAIDEIAKANNGKVPKAELERYLENEGKVRLEEVQFGDEPGRKRQEAAQDKLDARIQDLNQKIGEATKGEVTVRQLVSKYKSPDDLNPAARKLWDERTSALKERDKLNEDYLKNRREPKFGPGGSWILPGGENYREVVMAMPVPRKTQADLPSGYELKMTASGRWGVFGPSPQDVPEQRYGSGETRQEAIDSYFKLHQGTQFTSSHFPDVPNYVAHMRLNDRTDANGEPGTFLEELQSDRHQQGREKGYKEDVAYTEADLAKEGLSIEFRKAGQRYVIVDEFGNAFGEGQTKSAAIADLAKTRATTRIADAPFRKDWPLALFKRALRDAVALGKQWIGWTTGDTQAERYDLSKQVDEIRYSPNQKTLGAYKDERGLIDKSNVEPEDLPGIIGKEAADRILNNPTGVGATGVRTLSGVDLKVGGEGMKGFYDRILPTEVGKYVKQWGGKVEQGDLTGTSKYSVRRTEADGQFRDYPMENRRAAELEVAHHEGETQRTWTVVEEKGPPTPVWKVEITSQMKQGVAAGQLQFATRRGKAAQAQAEGISREESVAAAFERMHAAPEKRLSLLQRIKADFARIRAENAAAEAEMPAPAQVDPTEEINRLEAQETKALEDLDVEEQDALDRSSQQIAERYADRILAEQDVDARRALERESKNVAAAQRKGIEKQFAERRKALESDFRRQQQAVTSQAEQANLAATQEGAAQLSEMRRVHAFAELNALLKALPPAIRGRIGGAMTLAQLRTTETALTDFLTKRIAMIDRELERALKAEYIERIQNLLARFKPKRAESGVVKGRIGSDAQDVVIRVSGYVKMSGLEVQSRMKQIESELAAGGLDAEAESALLIEQHELSTFGAIDEMSAAELDAAHSSLQDTIATGRAAWGASEEARLADMRAKAAEIVDVLPPASSPGVAQKNRNVVVNWLKNYARNHTSFVQILGRLFPEASFVSDWESKAIKQDSADMDYVRQTQQRLVDAIGAALGTKSTVRIGDALGKMDKQTIPVPGGKASQREAIQYLFAWGQPQVRERMLNQGWTPAHIVALQKATRDPVSRALMTFFQQEYEAIYQRANPVYRKLYGMNLPRIEGTYAPMRYHGAGGPADISPTGVAISSGVTPSAIKGRVAHSALLRQVDSLAVFSEHLAQMSHWIHFAEFIRETRGVLNNATAKLALEQAIGQQGMSDLQKQLDSVTRNGVTRASDVSGINQFINHITKGVAVGSMAFNLHSAAVQGDSALRWMAAIPMQRWGNVLLAHRWLAAIPKAWHSDTVQRRVQQGTNPAVRLAMERNNLTPSLLLKAVDIGFWPINVFDGAATAVSSAIVYADSIQQGMSEEQALRKMDEAVARFSQPITVTSKTQALVNAGPSMKMLLMFMADPMLKTSIAMDGMLDIGRGKFEQGMRKIVAVELWSLTSQLILNTWAHYIIGEDDEDEDGWLFKNFWRAAIVAPLQGFFVLGDITEGLTRMAFGEKWWKKDTAAGRFVSDIVKTVSHLEDLMTADPSDPDFQKEVSNLIKVGGTIAGSGWAAAGAAVQRGVAGYQAAQEKLED